jgi:hypothetical protein
MCQSPKSEVAVTESVAESTDTTTTPALAEPTFPPALAIEEIPIELQAFMHALHDVDELKAYVDAARGCYLLEEGPGVYPIVTELTTLEDLLGNSEFIRFMNASYPARIYYVNTPGIDRCNLPAEGIYFNTIENNTLLLDTFAANLTASDETLTDDLKVKLTALDAARTWLCTISLSDKTGDLIALEIHLAQVNQKFFIAAIDTRGCGI